MHVLCGRNQYRKNIQEPAPFLTSTTHFQVLTFCEINERWRQVYFKYLLITWSPGIGEAVKCLHSWSLNIPISVLHLYELVVLSCCYSSIHKTCFFKRYSSEIEFLFFFHLPASYLFTFLFHLADQTNFGLFHASDFSTLKNMRNE